MLVGEVGVFSCSSPLYTFPEQYTTSLKHLLSVGVVQADFHTDLRRPVQARVRQARVGGRAAVWSALRTIRLHLFSLWLKGLLGLSPRPGGG